jgi:hypothetical protein
LTAPTGVPVDVMTHWKSEPEPSRETCKLLPVGHVVVVAYDDVVPNTAVEIPTPVTVAITKAADNATVLRRCLDECMSFIDSTVTTPGYAKPSNC